MSTFGSRTDIGSVREQNEDSLVVAPPLFVVADGMGGHEAGEVASEIAVEIIQEEAPDHPDADELGKAVERANRAIIDASLSGRGRPGMGTTCTAAMLEENKLVIAQVGDSRAYLMHGGSLSQLTRDHSLMANMIEAGQITPEEARFHPNRSVITRALGNDPDTVPDLYEINVEAGDRLLLCSDGLTSMVEDDDIADILARQADPQKCAIALVNAAIAAGGADNVTVVVADAEGGSGRVKRRLARRTKLTAVMILLSLVVIVALAGWGGYTYLHNTAYIAQNADGYVEVYRGVPGDVLGFSYSELVETTDVKTADLSPSAAERITGNMRVNSVDEALALVADYKAEIEKSKEEARQKEQAQKQVETGADGQPQGASGQAAQGEAGQAGQASSQAQDQAGQSAPSNDSQQTGDASASEQGGGNA